MNRHLEILSTQRPQPSAIWPIKLWVISVVAVTLLVGLAYTTVYSKDLPKTPPVTTLALTAPTPPDALGQDAVPDAPLPVDLYRFALNALLVPLLDDAEPRQWTDVAINFSCDPGTRVMVDGEVMVPGKRIPATTFTVRWVMDNCAPMGRESVALSGGVALRVFHEQDGLSALVIPEGLRIESHMGQAWLRGPFLAKTSLATSGTLPCTTGCATGTGKSYPAKKHVIASVGRKDIAQKALR